MAKEMSELGYIVKRIHLNGVPKRIVADPGVTLLTVIRDQSSRSEERRVGKECRSRWSPYH